MTVSSRFRRPSSVSASTRSVTSRHVAATPTPNLVVADGREDAEGVEQVLGRCVEQLSAFAQLFLESPLVGDVLEDDDGLQDRSPEVEDRVRVEGNEDVVALPVGDGELHRLRLAA